MECTLSKHLKAVSSLLMYTISKHGGKFNNSICFLNSSQLLEYRDLILDVDSSELICCLIVVLSADSFGLDLVNCILLLEGLILVFLQKSVFYKFHKHDIGQF